MMFGDLPPSSSETRFRLPAAACDDQLADLRRAGERDLVDARVGREGGAGRLAVAGDDVETPSGKPGLLDSSPSSSTDSGVCSAGLRTTVQPAASAGASFQAAIISG